MLGLWRAPEFHDPQFGKLKRIGKTTWHTPLPDGELGIAVEGTRERPHPEALERARQLFEEAESLVNTARTFVLNDKLALEFMQAGGELVCNGFTVRKGEEFTVDFCLSAWPDAMISVLFKGGAPCEIDLAD